NSGKTFSVMLPDVSVAWLAEGRNLRNQEGQLLTTLDADITAMTRVGDRLLVALRDQGLMIVDPAENFMALSFYPLAGEVSDVALNGEKLLAIVHGRLQGFEVSGNWISATPIRDGSATGQALYVDDESALDVNAYKDGFMVLRSGSAIAINSQWQTEPSSEVILEDARTMIRSGGRWYVATNSNRLLSFANRSEVLYHGEVNTGTVRMISMGRYLVGLSENGGIQLFDVTNPYHVQQAGNYQRDIQGHISQAQLFNGALWLGDASGSVIGIQQQSGEPVTVYASDNPRGHVVDVAITNGQVLAVASHYGAIYLGKEGSGWNSKIYPEKGWSLAVDRVLFDEEKAYLAHAEKRQVVAIDTFDLDEYSSPKTSLVFNNVAVQDLAVTNTHVVASESNFIHLAKKDNLKITGTLSLPQGEAIISLAAFGDVIYASTNNRRLYRVLPGELPLNSYAVVIESIIDGASDNIENLQTSGDHIYFNIGTSVHRLDLNTYVDSVIELPESAAINALHYANSNLWVAHRTSTASEVR